eukprot:gene18314-24776_t
MRFALFALLALQLYSASAQLGVTVNEAVDLKDALSKQDAEAKDLEGMLHWAIENSDPEELAKKAEEARNMDVDELRALLEERKQRVKELIVVELLNSSTSLEHRMYMLKELQVMVEPIDNANGRSYSLALYDVLYSSSLEQRQYMLKELQVMVEPIDNANDRS